MSVHHGLAGVGLLSLVLSFVGVTACTSSNDAGSGSGNGSSGACGLTFTGPSWASNCQTWGDTYCCSQEKACAANASCAQLVACINACPTPRQDACVHACDPAGGGPAADLLDAFGACTKATPSNGPDIPSSCEWPTG